MSGLPSSGRPPGVSFFCCWCFPVHDDFINRFFKRFKAFPVQHGYLFQEALPLGIKHGSHLLDGRQAEAAPAMRRKARAQDAHGKLPYLPRIGSSGLVQVFIKAILHPLRKRYCAGYFFIVHGVSPFAVFFRGTRFSALCAACAGVSYPIQPPPFCVSSVARAALNVHCQCPSRRSWSCHGGK